MIRTFLSLLLGCILFVATGHAAVPKLIVVISIDQFRYDYLVRFRHHFGKGGFEFFLQNGASFTNASFKHAINTTGPGHAALLSGAYGNTHGIIANDWYDRNEQRWVYCVEDRSVALLGSQGEGCSPRQFIGSTLGDELRLQYGFRSKVISISNKDRAAILMGGKMPTGVYWMKDSVFVTSTYYANELPDWVLRFNRSRVIDSYFGRRWVRLLPDSAYRMMDDDDVFYEADHDGSGRTFPHRITGFDSVRITPSYYYALARSPFSCEILSAFAKEAVRAEHLGKRNVPDLLCISFSAMDIVGHAYGPHSHEVMDMAVRLDRILADFLAFLDTTVGLRHCLLALSSDHGIAPIPAYMHRHASGVDAGKVPVEALKAYCSSVLTRRFGPPRDGAAWVAEIISNNIYLNRATFGQMKVPTLEWAASELADSLRTFAPIAAAYSSRQLATMPPATPLASKMQRSFHPLRSGDVMYALKPYWMEGNAPQGTTHGEPYEYDAHVPLIIVGNGIRAGSYAVEASPVDLAPTLAALLGLELPAAREGRVLVEVFK
ncbi:MAG TPA: alkaline phosphatase family protein [Bacteroidota bacterium]|nr:alkaline phosphatase family protein [Bacteroidota bacterium]